MSGSQPLTLPPRQGVSARTMTDAPAGPKEDAMHAYRSHTCADLTKSNVGDAVRLSGWVHRIRDHGGVLFIDLRDHYGVTQLLCDPTARFSRRLKSCAANIASESMAR